MGRKSKYRKLLGEIHAKMDDAKGQEREKKKRTAAEKRMEHLNIRVIHCSNNLFAEFIPI